MLNAVWTHDRLGHQQVRQQRKKLNSANDINNPGRALWDSDETAALTDTLISAWQETEPRTQLTSARNQALGTCRAAHRYRIVSSSHSAVTCYAAIEKQYNLPDHLLDYLTLDSRGIPPTAMKIKWLSRISSLKIHVKIHVWVLHKSQMLSQWESSVISDNSAWNTTQSS